MVNRVGGKGGFAVDRSKASIAQTEREISGL